MKAPWVRSQDGRLYNINHFVWVKIDKSDIVTVIGRYDNKDMVLGVYSNEKSAIQVMDWLRYWMEDVDNTSVFKFPSKKEVIIK